MRVTGNSEHGQKVVKYRLECHHHWWNFDSMELAEEGAKELTSDCDASITKIEEYWDRNGRLVDREKKQVH